MEEKINKIKTKFNALGISKIPIKFKLSPEAKIKLIELNNITNIEIYKHDLDKNDKNRNIILILHKILFILFDEEEIYSVINEDIFWEKCCDYLLRFSKGKLGDFIFGKIHKFEFNSKCVNKIETIIKDNKEHTINLINDLSKKNNILITPLIKEALEYCGIILIPSKTQGSIVIKNLKNNQIMINYLNNLKVRYFLSKYEEEDDDDDDEE